MGCRWERMGGLPETVGDCRKPRGAVCPLEYDFYHGDDGEETTWDGE